MGAVPVAQRMTAEEFLALPDTDDLRSAELVEGELVVDPPQPDVLWYAPGAEPDLDARPPSPLPHLAIEVRSPSTWRCDIGAKKAAYEREGLRELWLVDTDAKVVLIFRRSAEEVPSFDVALEVDDILTSPQLEGFELALGELFPE